MVPLTPNRAARKTSRRRPVRRLTIPVAATLAQETARRSRSGQPRGTLPWVELFSGMGLEFHGEAAPPSDTGTASGQESATI